jgi:uncharacterized glyoxalase superfamily protein PhnB
MRARRTARSGGRTAAGGDEAAVSKACGPVRRGDETQPGKEIDMRFMVMVKATEDSEAGVMPTQELMAEMGRFNEELVKAGIMEAGEGLHPSSKGARVQFSGARRSVVDGPFAETKELVAGFWLWKVKSMQEAVEWVKRCPNPMPGDSEIEIRPIFAAEDFGAEFTPELREQEDRLRAEIAHRQQGQQGGVNPVPDAAGAIPYLVVKGAADAIAYYQRVFGAEVVGRLDAPDGVLHAELKVGPARFMLTEERAERGALGPKAIGGSASHAVVYVPDADATVARAVEAGAVLGMPVADQFWGDRSGSLVDPFGHAWFISTHKEDLSPEQIGQRLQKLFEQGATGC